MGTFREGVKAVRAAAPRTSAPPYACVEDDSSDYSEPLQGLNYVQLNLVKKTEAFVTHLRNISIKCLFSTLLHLGHLDNSYVLFHLPVMQDTLHPVDCVLHTELQMHSFVYSIGRMPPPCEVL